MKLSPEFQSVCLQKGMGMSDNLIKALVSAAYKIDHSRVQLYLDEIDTVTVENGTAKVRLKAQPRKIQVTCKVH